MSFTESLKDKKTIILIAGALLIVIAVIVTLLPSGNRKYTADEEVISRRVKFEEGAGQGGAPVEAKTAPFEEPAAGPLAAKSGEQAEKEPARPAIKVELPEKADEPAQEKAPEKTREAEKEALKAKEPVKEAKAEAKPAAPTPKAAVSRKEEAPKVKKVKSEEAEKALRKRPDSGRLASLKPWAINVGSFSNRNDADSLASSLRAAGYNCYITPFKKGNNNWLRVRVGFFSTREDAEKASKKISSGFKVDTAWIVKPARGETAEHIK